MWFNLETAASKDTDVWREGKHLPPSDEHSSDTMRGRMEHSWSTPYSIGSKRTTTSKSATKIGLWWGLAASKGTRRRRRRFPRCACQCQLRWDRLGQLSTASCSTGQSFCWIRCLTECNCGANSFFSLCSSLMFFLKCVCYLPNLFGSVCDISMGVIFKSMLMAFTLNGDHFGSTRLKFICTWHGWNAF